MRQLTAEDLSAYVFNDVPCLAMVLGTGVKEQEFHRQVLSEALCDCIISEFASKFRIYVFSGTDDPRLQLFLDKYNGYPWNK